MTTFHAGPVLLGKSAVVLGLPQFLDAQIPKPGSGSGHKVAKLVKPLILGLNGGVRSLEDVRQITFDDGLCELPVMRRVPSSDAMRSV